MITPTSSHAKDRAPFTPSSPTVAAAVSRRVRVACAASLIALSLGSPAYSQLIVDGTRDAAYGDALAVQTVNTQFGDNASEWNAAYARIENDRLVLMLTGNLESNFNKLEIFVDSEAGGQSVFQSAGNDLAQRMDGLVFDTGFTADFHLIARRGFNGSSNVFDLDFADLEAGTFSSHGNVFATQDSGTGTTGVGINQAPILVGYNGSNSAGIVGGTDAADQDAARAVTTGLELSISLADLDYTSGPIRVMVGQNGSGHDFWSNQFLGGLPAPQGNLGGDENGNFTGEGAINMNNFAGNQYFTVVPEPATVGLLTVGAMLLGCRSRRRSR